MFSLINKYFNKCYITEIIFNHRLAQLCSRGGNSINHHQYYSNFSALLCQEHVNFQWDDDEVRFVQDQHAYLDYYKASSLKQHIILIPSQPVILLNAACLAEKQQTPFFCLWFDPIWLEHTIYSTRCGDTNHYTTDKWSQYRRKIYFTVDLIFDLRLIYIKNVNLMYFHQFNMHWKLYFCCKIEIKIFYLLRKGRKLYGQFLIINWQWSCFL